MQVVWLKVELSKLLEEKRSAILRLTFSPRNQVFMDTWFLHAACHSILLLCWSCGRFCILNKLGQTWNVMEEIDAIRWSFAIVLRLQIYCCGLPPLDSLD